MCQTKTPFIPEAVFLTDKLEFVGGRRGLKQTLPVTGNTQRTNPENRVHYPALDGVRAVAFLLVFFHHACFLPWGWCGVSFFFVLSGFLITGILIDTRDHPHRIRNFYVRRTLRIFPLYWGIFLALLISTPLFRWKWSLPWLAWPLYLGNYLPYISSSPVLGSAAKALLPGARTHGTILYFGHFWSLCIEEQFYLLWPWLIFYVRRSRVLLLSTVIVFALPVIRAVLHGTLPAWMVQRDILYRITPFQLDALVLGAILAILWRGAHRDVLLRSSRIALPVLFVIAGAFIGYGMFQALPHPFWAYARPAWEYTWGQSFFNLFGAVLILNALQPSTLISRLFGWRPARWLGRISYGAYVFHDIALPTFSIPGKWLAMHLGASKQQATLIGQHWTWAFALPSTILIAWLSFRFWESPFLNLKERWTVRPTQTGEQLKQFA